MKKIVKKNTRIVSIIFIGFIGYAISYPGGGEYGKGQYQHG